MKDELITYETSKLASERLDGWNEYAPDFYYDHDGRFGVGNPYPLGHYTVRTQTYLQRWLREKHDITVNAYRTWAMHSSYNYSVLQGNDVDNEIIQACEPNRTYEQALEAGLQEALKLIESK